MNKYLLENLKKNMRKYIIMLVLLFICSTFIFFTVELISSLALELEMGTKDMVSRQDAETMVMMLYIFIGIVIGFSFLMIDNTYSIILSGRTLEFQLLYKLGLHKGRIKRMLFMEGTIISCIAGVAGIFVSGMLSKLLMEYFDLEMQVKLSYSTYLFIMAGVCLAVVYILNKHFKVLEINQTAMKKNKKNLQRFSKNQIRIIKVLFVAGAMYLLLYYLGAFNLLLENNMLAKMILFWLAVFIALDGAIYYLLLGLKYIAKRLNMVPMLLASEQNIYNYKKVKASINALIFAVILLVGFQGIYESIRETTRIYINESINYDYMIITNKPMEEEESIREIINRHIEGDRLYSLALNINVTDANGRNFTITGMEEDYNRLQKLYLQERGDMNKIHELSDRLYVIYPSHRVDNWGINGEVMGHTLDGEAFPFYVAEAYDPINLRQGFTSRSALSHYMYGNTYSYNTLYFTNFSIETVDQILATAGIEEGEYVLYPMATLRTDSINQVINGTEIIEAAIYICLLFVASMILNIFVLSYTDRNKQYMELRILGTSKVTLVKSMIFESILICITGTIIGWALAIPFIQGGLEMMKSQLVFDTYLFLPYPKLIISLTLIFVVIILATMMIGIYSLRGKLLKYNYRE